MWLIRNHAVKCKGIKSTEFYVLRRNYFHTIHIEGPETHSLAWKRMIVLPQMQHNKVCLVQCAQMRLKFNQRCNSMLTACYCGSTSRLMRNMMQFYWIKVCRQCIPDERLAFWIIYCPWPIKAKQSECDFWPLFINITFRLSREIN